MLDDIMRMAMEAVELTDAQVEEARKMLLAEVATVDARAAATDALWNPNGSTTRLENVVPGAQQKLSDHRDALIKAAPKFIALVLAVEVARQRRDDAEKMLELKRKAASSAGFNGLPKELADWYPRLERHGVKRSYLGEFSNETVAIIADLIRWKAKDARFRNPDNPWRAILGIYAERVIVQPDRKFVASLSEPGTPTKPRHISSDRHYMFNEMHRELPPAPAEVAAVPAVSGILDCSIYPASADPMPSTGDAAVEDPETSTAQAVKADSAVPDVQEPDEYALPPHISEADVSTLQSVAQALMDGDTDWSIGLREAIGRETDEQAVISKVAAQAAWPGDTPFGYFVEAARAYGVEAGHAAYREATVRRVALELATLPKNADIRYHAKLGW